MGTDKAGELVTDLYALALYRIGQLFCRRLVRAENSFTDLRDINRWILAGMERRARYRAADCGIGSLASFLGGKWAATSILDTSHSVLPLA